jgi:DNA-binding transcriptional regulator YiaG
MTQIKAKYDNGHLPVNIKEFSTKPCCMSIENIGFERPTTGEVRELRLILDLSQVELAKMAGASYTLKGSTTVQKWENEVNNDGKSRINLAAWQLMLIKAGFIKLDLANSILNFIGCEIEKN